ncbi:hypothetical protein Q31a_62450 [Aureliella helgolandensis]|uniref:Uncharacterized protein n=1 Tax=Aureliella helgolandensis TaxID=2527968 RepID=A0A518GGY4_9BACT|nr:hypothetical protein Q31a_62450 [Aureliella helgolandensis]
MGAGNTSKLRWFLSIHAIVVAPKINLQTTWLKIHSLGGLLFQQPVTRRVTIPSGLKSPWYRGEICDASQSPWELLSGLHTPLAPLSLAIWPAVASTVTPFQNAT